MDISPLLPAGFILCGHQVTDHELTIGLIANQSIATCPLCQTTSTRVHSFYQRTLADLPISGKRVYYTLSLRKFFCAQPACPRKVVAQSCSQIVKPYGRRCRRADSQIQAIGLRTGAKPGANLCQWTGLAVSASTVLRVIHQTALPDAPTPKRLGVDDRSLRRTDSEKAATTAPFRSIWINESPLICYLTGKRKHWRPGFRTTATADRLVLKS